MKFKIKKLFIQLLNLNQITNLRTVSSNRTFRLGSWDVDPELSRISRDGQHHDLQPQVMDLLVYLAEHHKEVVSNEDLLSRLWPGRVVTTSSIYSCLKQLRAALGDDAQSPRYIKTIPKRGYRLIAELDWASDREDTDQHTAADAGAATGQRFFSRSTALALLVVTVSAISYMIFHFTGPSHVPETDTTAVPQSIAVLPFTDMTPEQDHGWFSDGMAEEVLNKLAQIPGLKVAGRQSSFSFRNSDADLQTVGEILGVSHLLEGSVRRDGDRVRVTAQLIRADDGFHVWSQEYDRDLSDTITIQNDISSRIADSLTLKIPVEEQPARTSPPSALYPRISAYELYLQSLDLIEQNTKLSLLNALEKLEKALETEPEYAEVHVAIVRVYRALTYFRGFYKEDMYRELDDLARPHLEKALAINPGLAEVQLLFGDMSDQPGEAIEAYNRALAINPNLYRAHMGLAVKVMDELRSWGDCMTHLERAIEIEPLSIEAATMMVNFLQFIPHRWQEAENLIAELERQHPDSPDVQRTRARWMIFVQGRPADAVPILESLLVKNPDDGLARGYLIRSWYMLGEIERALESRLSNPYWQFVLAPDRQQSLRQMADAMTIVEQWPREETYAHRMLYGYIYVMLGEWQQAIDLLEEDLHDLDRFAASMPAYVQQLGQSESPTMSLAVAYKKLGDEEQFSKYAAFERSMINIRSENGRLHNAHYSRTMARLDAMEGRPYEALMELEHLVTNGKIDPRDLIHPAFDDLRGKPEFTALEDLQLKRMNSEREKLGLMPLPGMDVDSVAQGEKR